MRCCGTALLAAMLIASSARGDLFVSGYDAFATPRIVRYDEVTGAYLGLFSNRSEAPTAGLAVGPDHELYLAGQVFEAAHLYRATGVSQGYLVQPSNNPANGWTGPKAIAFGPEGNLYVTSNFNAIYGSLSTSGILRYRTDGTYLGKFANTSGWYLAFGPNGDLFVSQVFPTVDIRRFRGSDGALLGVFAAEGSGGLTNPRGITCGLDGNLYVISSGDRVLRFDGATGAFIDTFISAGAGGIQKATDLAFGPDGNLYVCANLGPANSLGTATILKYSGSTGTSLGTLVPPTLPDNTKGLIGGSYMTFGYIPEPSAAAAMLFGFALAGRRARRAL